MLAVSVRRFRFETIEIVTALGAVGLLALATGLRISNEYQASGLADCLTLGSRADCQALIEQFDNRFASLQILIAPLVLLPGLLGAFIGAPMVARELEAGTHRFLWTQAITRQKWYLQTSLVACALAAAAGAVYVATAAVWLDITNQVTDERFGQLYDLQGIVPAAACVFAVAVGIASGVIIGRTLTAMATTTGIFVAVRIATAVLLRPRFATPLTLSVPYSRTDPLAGSGAWEISNRTVDATGAVLGQSGSLNVTELAGRCPGISTAPGSGLPGAEVINQCLRDLDVRSVIQYHPGERFWVFQSIESMILLGLAGLFIVVGLVALRRNVT